MKINKNYLSAKFKINFFAACKYETKIIMGRIIPKLFLKFKVNDFINDTCFSGIMEMWYRIRISSREMQSRH